MDPNAWMLEVIQVLMLGFRGQNQKDFRYSLELVLIFFLSSKVLKTSSQVHKTGFNPVLNWF